MVNLGGKVRTNAGAPVRRARDLLRLIVARCLNAGFVAVIALAAMAGAGAAAERVVVRDGDGSGVIARTLEETLNLPADAVGDTGSPEFIAEAAMESERLEAVLRGYGYYAADVQALVNRVPVPDVAEPGESGPVTFVATLGPLYHIGSFHLLAEGAPVSAGNARPDVVGQPATAEILTNLEAEWRGLMRDVGYPFAEGAKRRVTRDDTARTIDVTVEGRLGPLVRLGPVRFIGALATSPATLAAAVPFQPGERYRAQNVQALEAAVAALPSIEKVWVRVSPVPGDDGLHPVTVTVAEVASRQPDRPLDGMIGMGVLGAAALSVAAVQLARARTGDAAPWRSHWSFYLIAFLLAASAAMAAMRIAQFLG